MSKAARDELEWLPQSKRLPHSKRVRTWMVRAAIALSALGHFGSLPPAAAYPP